MKTNGVEVDKISYEVGNYGIINPEDATLGQFSRACSSAKFIDRYFAIRN